MFSWQKYTPRLRKLLPVPAHLEMDLDILEVLECCCRIWRIRYGIGRVAYSTCQHAFFPRHRQDDYQVYPRFYKFPYPSHAPCHLSMPSWIPYYSESAFQFYHWKWTLPNPILQSGQRFGHVWACRLVRSTFQGLAWQDRPARASRFRVRRTVRSV